MMKNAYNFFIVYLLCDISAFALKNIYFKNNKIFNLRFNIFNAKFKLKFINLKKGKFEFLQYFMSYLILNYSSF